MRIEGLYPTGYTSVPHIFIDQYMVSANGEFVKTYLFLLRLSESGDLGVCELADRLAQTESDVRRALHYWRDRGLLRLTEKNGEIESISVLFPQSDARPKASAETEKSGESVSAAPQKVTADAKEGTEAPLARSYSAEQLKQLKNNADFDQLLFALEHYLGRSLSDRDTDILAYLYDELGFPGEVLEYLAEYCVERWERENKKKDHHLMRYMEKVALNWHSQGAVTLEKAKKQTALFARDSAAYVAVAKALGLKGRQLTEGECRYVTRWLGEMQMPQELVLEACERTIRKKNTPDFRYTEGILKSWQKEGLQSLAALGAWEAGKAAGEKSGSRSSGRKQAGYEALLKNVDYAKLLYKKETP